MKKLLLCIASVTLALTSCQKTPSTSVESNNISFKSEIKGSTKVVGSNFEQGDQISVVAVDQVSSAMSAVYSYNGSAFASEAPFVKESASEELSYMATYPAVEGIEEGFYFDVEADQSGDGYEMSDLLVASTEPTAELTPTLVFDHVLSSLVFDVKSTEGEEITPSSINLYAKSSVSCDIEAASFEAEGDVYEITPAQKSNGGYKTILAPQTIDANDKFASIEYDGVVYEASFKTDVIFASTYQYNYSFVIDVVSQTVTVEFIGADINDWNQGDLPLVEEEDEELTIELNVEEVTSSDVTVSMTPSDNDAQYVFSLLDVAMLDNYIGTEEDIQQLIIDAINNSSNASAFYVKGPNTMKFVDLDPNTKYYYVAMGCDGEVATSDLFKITVNTLPAEGSDIIDAPADMEITVTIDPESVTYETMVVDYVPELDNARYFYGICEWSKYSAFMGSDEEFMASVIDEWYNGDFVGGVKTEYTHAEVNGLPSDTRMMFLAFGVKQESNGTYTATTELYYDKEYTEPAPILFPDVEFGSISAHDASMEYFNITLTPNDKEMPYYIGVVSQGIFDSWYAGPDEDELLVMDDIYYAQHDASGADMTIEEFYNSILKKGDCEHTYGPTFANNDYVVYAYGFDVETLQPLSTISYTYISTLETDPSAAPVVKTARVVTKPSIRVVTADDVTPRYDAPGLFSIEIDSNAVKTSNAEGFRVLAI